MPLSLQDFEGGKRGRSLLYIVANLAMVAERKRWDSID